MNNKNIGIFIATCIGVAMVVFGFINYKNYSFVIIGLGVALVGTIESYLKNKKDTTTEDGKSRNVIDMYDERTIFVNAKSGEIVNYIMDFCTIIALILAKLLNVSFEGMIIILSLIIIRLIINPLAKNYYEKKI